MREAALAEFFLDRLPAAALAQNAVGATRQLSGIRWVNEIEDMSGGFLVTRGMAIALCDAVLSGDLPAEDLATVGFMLVSSDHFYWAEDDDEPAATFYDWASPEINYALTIENIRMFRARLARPSEASK
jgi:hypothetical protein